MKFSKFEALGNDFLIVLAKEIPRPLSPSDLAREICERRRGVGADGLLVIRHLDDPRAEISMQVWNADGTEAEISGNGLRCAAAFEVLGRGSQLKEISIDTRAGVRVLRLVEHAGSRWVFVADMGEPMLSSEAIPVTLSEAQNICVDHPIEVGGMSLRATLTSMGNPHCSIFVRDFQSIDWRGLGPLIEHLPLFPNRTNVEFIRVVDPDHIEVRFWERGAGETLSSGTGACAAAVASVLNGLADRSVRVLTPAGELKVDWTDTGVVMLQGPVRFVFRGDWSDSAAQEGLVQYV